MNGQPVIVVVGIDPEKHLIPPLLAHHVAKMKKDFLIGFISEEDLSERTGQALKDMLTRSGFKPDEKKRIITGG